MKESRPTSAYYPPSIMAIILVRDLREDEGGLTGDPCGAPEDCQSGLCANGICSECTEEGSDCSYCPGDGSSCYDGTCLKDPKINGALVCMSESVNPNDPNFQILLKHCSNLNNMILPELENARMLFEASDECLVWNQGDHSIRCSEAVQNFNNVIQSIGGQDQDFSGCDDVAGVPLEANIIQTEDYLEDAGC